VKLRWGATIRARELKVYGPALGDGSPGTRDEVIHGLGVAAFLEGVEVQSLAVQKDILPEGTSIALASEVEFDALVITLSSQDVTGLYEGKKGPALAEVEVIAQATGEAKVSFLRGDVDCNGQLQLTDSVRILGQLFLGGRSVCCMAAADANDDTLVNISDAIFLLNFLFLGGRSIPPPFPGCEPAPTSGLVCDASVCG
jgi:hypothetical protein